MNRDVTPQIFLKFSYISRAVNVEAELNAYRNVNKQGDPVATYIVAPTHLVK